MKARDQHKIAVIGGGPARAAVQLAVFRMLLTT
jgi:hypothetical protein